MEAGKPSKPIGIVVSAVMLIYAVSSLYSAWKIWSGYSSEAVGTVVKVEGNFVPGNHLYVSQFSNLVTYEFEAAGNKKIVSKVDSLMLSFSRPGSAIRVLYDANSPERYNIPANSFYGYIVAFVTMATLGGLLLKVSLSL